MYPKKEKKLCERSNQRTGNFIKVAQKSKAPVEFHWKRDSEYKVDMYRKAKNKKQYVQRNTKIRRGEKYIYILDTVISSTGLNGQPVLLLNLFPKAKILHLQKFVSEISNTT